MKQRIRLTESQLHNIIRNCVNEAMKENQGFMDGIKGAVNAYKGDTGESVSDLIKNMKKGYKQGQQDQQDTIEKDKIASRQEISKAINVIIPKWLKRADSYLNNNDIDNVLDACEYIRDEMEYIIKTQNKKADTGVDYKYDGRFQNA